MIAPPRASLDPSRLAFPLTYVGKGGQGLVYKAFLTEEHGQRPVALKVGPPCLHAGTVQWCLQSREDRD